MILIPISIVTKSFFYLRSKPEDLHQSYSCSELHRYWYSVQSMQQISTRRHTKIQSKKLLCDVSIAGPGSVHESPFQSANPSIRFHYPDNNFIFVTSKGPRFINYSKRLGLIFKINSKQILNFIQPQPFQINCCQIYSHSTYFEIHINFIIQYTLQINW